MIHHITKIACFSCLCAGYYYISNHNRISLENKYLAKMLNFVQQNKPALTIVLFKMLLKSNLIDKNNKFSQFVLKDFDSEGRYIQEVRDLGFKGIQIGPVSFNSSAPDEQVYHLGVKHTLSYIYGYRNLSQTSDFQVYLNVVPNLEILKFAPYLLKQNIMQSIQFFSSMQKISKEKKILNGITVDFERKTFVLQKNEETQKLKDQIKKEATSLIDEFNKTGKNQIQIQFQKRPYKTMAWEDLFHYIIKNNVTV